MHAGDSWQRGEEIGKKSQTAHFSAIIIIIVIFISSSMLETVGSAVRRL